jgi:hypothetical protein
MLFLPVLAYLTLEIKTGYESKSHTHKSMPGKKKTGRLQHDPLGFLAVRRFCSSPTP